MYVTTPADLARVFSPVPPEQIGTQSVNITPHFTVNRPCPCVPCTPQGLKFQRFPLTIPKMLIYGTLTEFYIVYKMEIVYNPFRNGVVGRVRKRPDAWTNKSI